MNIKEKISGERMETRRLLDEAVKAVNALSIWLEKHDVRKDKKNWYRSNRAWHALADAAWNRMMTVPLPTVGDVQHVLRAQQPSEARVLLLKVADALTPWEGNEYPGPAKLVADAIRKVAEGKE